MAYATFSKGFEPGRVNSGALGLDDPADVVSAPFKAEVATNYEAGLKGSVADGKLVFELAGFYIDTKDRQEETRALIGSRSEARRVGKECVSTGRARGSPDPQKKKNQKEKG